MKRSSKSMGLKIATAAMVLGAATGSHAALQTVFQDDFSGDLSGWDLNRLESGHTVSINGSGQAEFDAAGAGRGMPTANVVIPDSATLAAIAGPGGVALSVSMDVIASTHGAAGGVVIGAPEYTDGTESIENLLLYDGLAGNGGNEYVIEWTNPNAVWTSSGSSVWTAYANVFNFGGTINAGDRTRIDFVTSDGVTVDSMNTYVNGVLQDTLTAAEAPVAFSSGQVGFYMNNDRDFTIDNFMIEIAAVPEPTTLAALGMGAIGLLMRRRSA